MGFTSWLDDLFKRKWLSQDNPKYELSLSGLFYSISFTQEKNIYNSLIAISHWTAMTNAYTTRDPPDAQGILIWTTLLESSSSNSGSNWQRFSFGAVALRRFKTRMHKHSRGQASAELGEKPKIVIQDNISHTDPGSSLGRLSKMIREEWYFGGERPQNENNIYGFKPFLRILTITTFVQIENSRRNEVCF